MAHQAPVREGAPEGRLELIGLGQTLADLVERTLHGQYADRRAVMHHFGIPKSLPLHAQLIRLSREALAPIEEGGRVVALKVADEHAFLRSEALDSLRMHASMRRGGGMSGLPSSFTPPEMKPLHAALGRLEYPVNMARLGNLVKEKTDFTLKEVFGSIDRFLACANDRRIVDGTRTREGDYVAVSPAQPVPWEVRGW